MRRALLAVAMTACSLFPPLDGLTGAGGDDAGSDARGDAAAPAGDAGSDAKGEAAAQDAGGPITYVQGTHLKDLGYATTSWTTDISLPAQAHDALVVAVIVYQGGGPVTNVTVTDAQGDTFGQSTTVVSTDAWMNGVIFTAFDVKGGLSTASVHSSGTAIQGQDVYLLEYANIHALEIGVGGAGTATGPDNMVSGTGNVSFANSLLVGFGGSGGSTTAGTGFTTRLTDTASLVEDLVVADAGTYQATATMESDAGYYWIMLMAAYQGL